VRPLSRAGLTAVLATALLGLPAGAHGEHAAPAPRAPVTSADLPRLQAELGRVTARAQQLADELEAAAARDGGLRTTIDRLAQKQELAQARLDARVREVYMRTTLDPVPRMVSRMAAPGLERITEQGAAAAVRVERELVDAVASSSAAVVELLARVEAHRAALRARAAEVLAAQDRARDLLAQAEALLAAEQAAAADAAARAAAKERAAAQQAQLRSARAVLDRVSASVTAALTPAQTRRSRNAARTEAPIVALVEAAGSGYPQGYAPTGTVLRGPASWYGPGFVGNPTASGAPYDPERLTCAHKTLPLGTVIRVSANGRTVSCLVNDRGPYVADRILDMSRAGSRALGYDGVTTVGIEVLSPV
jgi:rare lipoprotein A